MLFRSGHQAFRQGDTVVFQVDNAQLIFNSGIVVNQLAQLADHADHLLGHVVAGGSLGAEDIGLGHKVSVRVCLQVQVLSGNVHGVQVLALVLGAFLAMAIIVISYLFNDTIITAEDVEKKLGLNVLGTLPLEEAEDDGENCSGSKKGFSKARKKSKKRAGDKS